MPLTHLLLALAVVAIWGTNFVVIRLGLDTFAPYTFAALRYTFSFLPFIFFIRKPAMSWAKLAAFGVLIGVGQFGLLFWAMRSDISPGLASLVIQSQVFFTIAMSAALYRERLKALQWPAFALAIGGLAIVASHVSTGAGVTLFGIALVIAAAVSWAAGNLVARSAGRVDALGFMVWSSPFAALPLWCIALAQDGGARVGATLIAMPSPSTTSAGKKIVQYDPPMPGRVNSAKPVAAIKFSSDTTTGGSVRCDVHASAGRGSGGRSRSASRTAFGQTA